MTAQAVYATMLVPPVIKDTYVVVRLSPAAPFGAWVTQGTVTRPLLCVTY